MHTLRNKIIIRICLERNSEKYLQYASNIKKPVIPKAKLEDLKTEVFAPREREKGYSPAWVTQVLQSTMIPYYVLYVKKEDRLKAALTTVEFLRDHFGPKLLAKDPHELRLAIETKNMILSAEMKLKASLFRTESRGNHYREDYPARDDDNWLAWVKLRDENNKMSLSKVPIPEEWRPDQTIPYEERYFRRYPGELEFLGKK